MAPRRGPFQAAAANADWAHAPGYHLILTNQPGEKSWPITGASFILVYSVPPDPAATAAALKFFDWAYRNGGKMAAELDYVPLPDEPDRADPGDTGRHRSRVSPRCEA